MSKIGIFSGTFDPVHAGHIAFALKALEHADLDEVVFLPEALPRRKEGITHIAHRLAMLELALKPYPKLKVLELPDKQFNVKKSLPRLKKIYKGDELHMLVGSDLVDLLVSPSAAEQWPDIDQMIKEVKLIVAVRDKRIREEHRQKLDMLSSGSLLIASSKPGISSRHIRESLYKGKPSRDLLPSIQKYVKDNWLYASVADAPSKS